MGRARTLLRCAGGTLVLPAQPLLDRADGGHLLANPPREVWERGELTAGELRDWACLVAAAGWAMLAALPQLKGGCINYWEAGNWALNDEADPRGPKSPEAHRRVHLHLLGRSATASHPDWQWGESPRFPSWRDKDDWARRFVALDDAECAAVATATADRLRDAYAMAATLEVEA